VKLSHLKYWLAMGIAIVIAFLMLAVVSLHVAWLTSSYENPEMAAELLNISVAGLDHLQYAYFGGLAFLLFFVLSLYLQLEKWASLKFWDKLTMEKGKLARTSIFFLAFISCLIQCAQALEWAMLPNAVVYTTYGLIGVAAISAIIIAGPYWERLINGHTYDCNILHDGCYCSCEGEL